MKRIITSLAVIVAGLLGSQCASYSGEKYEVAGSALSSNCSQVIIGLTDDWNNSYVKLRFMEKDDDGQWRQIGNEWPGRLGATGSVWGLGVNPVPKGGRLKQEGDKRTPAGIYEIDHKIFAYKEDTPVGHGYAVHKVTPNDLWVEDAKSPLYNHHLILDHAPHNGWEKKQQMKQDDPSHKIKLFIHHNSPKDKKLGRPVAKGGSSIFFHIWRDAGKRATAGCTSMSEADIMRMLELLDAGKNPMYIMLPREEYRRYKEEWDLPAIDV